MARVMPLLSAAVIVCKAISDSVFKNWFEKEFEEVVLVLRSLH